MEISRLEGIIEAILFTMGNSVELSKIAAAIGHDEETTRRLIHNMMDKYETDVRVSHQGGEAAPQVRADRRAA